jgi:hypothetical protein
MGKGENIGESGDFVDASRMARDMLISRLDRLTKGNKMENTVVTALRYCGMSGELTPEVGASLYREYQSWSARPTKKHTSEALVAHVKLALARVAMPGMFGASSLEALEQLRRSLAHAGVR